MIDFCDCFPTDSDLTNFDCPDIFCASEGGRLLKIGDQSWQCCRCNAAVNDGHAGLRKVVDEFQKRHCLQAINAIISD